MPLRTSNPSLKLGTARVDITPTRAVPLAGFSSRRGVFEGVLHPLAARILTFELQDCQGRPRHVVLVSADLIWFDTSQAIRLKEKISARWGVEGAAILLHATHNHSGPQTSGVFAPSIGTMDREYVSRLENAVLRGVEESLKQSQPVFAERGRGICGIGIHRRCEVAGKIVMVPNAAGPNDPELQVIAFKSVAGITRAMIVHYTCHPTTTADNYVSSEFPGLAMQRLEDLEGVEVAMYLQGCCGDIRPALIRDGCFYRGTDAEVCALGMQLADQVVAILRSPMEHCRPGLYKVKELSIPLRFQIVHSEAEPSRDEPHSGVQSEGRREEHPATLPPGVALEVNAFDLCTNLSLLGMNAEMVVEYGLFIKRQFSNQVLPVAYSNGMIGYVTTAQQLAEGGYEPIESCHLFGLPAPLASDSEARIREGLGKYLSQ